MGANLPEEFRSWRPVVSGVVEGRSRSMVAAVAEAIGSSKLHKQILGDSPSKREVLNRVQEEGVEFVDLQFTDVMGHVKSVTIPCVDLRARHRRRAVDRRLVDRRVHAYRGIGHVPHAGPVHLRRHSLGPAASTPRPASSAGSTTPMAPRSRATRAASCCASWNDSPSLATRSRPVPSWSSSCSRRTATRSHRCPTTARGISTTPAIWPTPSARTW